MSERRRITRAEVLRLAVAVLFFAAAPTAGDIGSCGQSPDDLDARKFFTAKAAIDCEQCTACSLHSTVCDHACLGFVPDQTSFPPGCYPLVHDGEVCLHALEAAGCRDYASYVSDVAPSAPTECDFCPPGER